MKHNPRSFVSCELDKSFNCQFCGKELIFRVSPLLVHLWVKSWSIISAFQQKIALSSFESPELIEKIEELFSQASLEMQQIQKFERKKKKLVDILNQAVEQKDIEKLTASLEEAKKCGISIRPYKKTLRTLVRIQTLRDQLHSSIQTKNFTFDERSFRSNQ